MEQDRETQGNERPDSKLDPTGILITDIGAHEVALTNSKSEY